MAEDDDDGDDDATAPLRFRAKSNPPSAPPNELSKPGCEVSDKAISSAISSYDSLDMAGILSVIDRAVPCSLYSSVCELIDVNAVFVM